MKKGILTTTLGLGIVVLALNVNSQELTVDKSADDVGFAYECSNANLETLKVTYPVTKDNVSEVNVFYSQPKTMYQKYSAILVQKKSPLYNVSNYELFQNEIKVGDLKIVTHQFIGRGGCGRAGCNDQIHQTQAQLKLETYEATFDCQ